MFPFQESSKMSMCLFNPKNVVLSLPSMRERKNSQELRLKTFTERSILSHVYCVKEHINNETLRCIPWDTALVLVLYVTPIVIRLLILA
jgi:hypothetical protein